jgi:hypothetical protein
MKWLSLFFVLFTSTKALALNVGDKVDGVGTLLFEEEIEPPYSALWIGVPVTKQEGDSVDVYIYASGKSVFYGAATLNCAENLIAWNTAYAGDEWTLEEAGKTVPTQAVLGAFRFFCKK